MVRGLVRFLLVVFGLYLAYGALMVKLHPAFIYPFAQDSFYGAGYERVEVPVAQDDPIPVYVAKGKRDAPTILYFMGNVGALELFRPMLDHHKRAGRTVVAMTYRGGGGVPGSPSEAVLKRDALAVYDAFSNTTSDGPVVVHGYSLGTGLALHVAANRAPDGVVLAAPYARLCDLMTTASYLPACWMPVQRWDSVSSVDRVRADTLILHGTEDQLIPIAQGQELRGALEANDVTVTFVPIEKGGHTDLMRRPGYLEAIDAFVDRASIP